MADDTAELKARIASLVASRLRGYAAAYDAAAAAIRATAAAKRLTEAFLASEARDVAEHPDLAELNVRLDGYYGAQ